MCQPYTHFQVSTLFIGTKQALKAKIDQILWTQQGKAWLGIFSTDVIRAIRSSHERCFLRERVIRNYFCGLNGLIIDDIMHIFPQNDPWVTRDELKQLSQS